MKKLLAYAIASLVVLSAQAQSTGATSEEKVKVQDKPILDRLSVAYYAEYDTDRIKEHDDETLSNYQTQWYHSFIFSAEITEVDTLQWVIRGNFNEVNKDAYDEYDPRVRWRHVYFSDDVATLRTDMQIELPMSRYSDYENGDRRIIRFRPSIHYIRKIDDLNSVFLYFAYQRTYYHEASASTDETVRFNFLPYISYTNTYFSENYALRIDYEAFWNHMPGENDFHFKSIGPDERILIGTSFNIGSVNLYPYLQHFTAVKKALDRTGAGLQVFATF